MYTSERERKRDRERERERERESERERERERERARERESATHKSIPQMTCFSAILPGHQNVRFCSFFFFLII